MEVEEAGGAVEEGGRDGRGRQGGVTADDVGKAVTIRDVKLS
jgi:hypothetical protein